MAAAPLEALMARLQLDVLMAADGVARLMKEAVLAATRRSRGLAG